MNRRNFFTRTLAVAAALLTAPLLALGRTRPQKLGELDALVTQVRDFDVPAAHASSRLLVRDESHLFNPMFRYDAKATKILLTRVDNSVVESFLHRYTGEVVVAGVQRVPLRPNEGSGFRPELWRRQFNLARCLGVEFEYTSQSGYVQNKGVALRLLAMQFDALVRGDLVHLGCLTGCSSLELATLKGVRREMLFLYPVGTKRLDAQLERFGKVPSLGWVGTRLDTHWYLLDEGQLPRVVVRADGRVQVAYSDREVELRPHDPAQSYVRAVGREARRRGL